MRARTERYQPPNERRTKIGAIQATLCLLRRTDRARAALLFRGDTGGALRLGLLHLLRIHDVGRNALGLLELFTVGVGVDAAAEGADADPVPQASLRDVGSL